MKMSLVLMEYSADNYNKLNVSLDGELIGDCTIFLKEPISQQSLDSNITAIVASILWQKNIGQYNKCKNIYLLN